MGGVPAVTMGIHHYIYAAFNDGSIHVYDIDAGHAEVTSFATVTGVSDVRGVCAVQGGVFYLSHQRPEAGYVVAVDLRTQAVLWSHAYQPNVDRLSCAAGGKKLYVPSNESYSDDELIVVDAATGAEIDRIPISPNPHDSVPNLSGTHVYIETKSSQVIDVVDTGSDTVVGQIGPFAGIGGPFTINGAETLLFGNFFGVNGFQVGDIDSGTVLATVSIGGQTAVAGELDQHGIALNPSETEVWVDDGVGNLPAVHVFDATVMPPAPKVDVPLDFAGPHWVTFTIDGAFAYVAGPKLGGLDTDVIDALAHRRVATIGPSEDLLEIDWANGTITGVGSQFGVGRAP
jgi:DNA-binding beta-propeller fold protein YncE